MEDMNLTELALKEAKENTLREVIIILQVSRDLEEAKEEVKALLNK